MGKVHTKSGWLGDEVGTWVSYGDYKQLEAQLVEKEITIDQLTVTANTWNRKYDDECILTAHLQAQLPEGMQDCTIIFKECEVGHGWLTAKNWKQFDCPTCRIAELEAQLESAKIDIERLVTYAEKLEAQLAETQKELLRENDLFLAMRERATKSKQHI